MTILLCALSWASPSYGEDEPEQPGLDARQLATPREVARFGVSLPPIDNDKSTVGLHHVSVVRAGAPLGDHWAVGAVANWTVTQLRLPNASDNPQTSSDWYRGLLLAPALTYTEADWCIAAAWAVGYQGSTWNRHALRHVPTLIGCWASSTRTLYRLGGSMLWRPSSGDILPYPIFGWQHRGTRWQASGLLPFWADVTYWTTAHWGVGGRFVTQIVPYSTEAAAARQLTLFYPALGPSVVFKTHGVHLGVMLGPSLNGLVTSKERDFDSPKLAPFVRLDLAIYEDLFR